MSQAVTPKWQKATVWIFRLITGLTFIVSGWAKAVDPYGVVYKIGEYLSALSLAGVPREIVIITAIIIAIFEFTTGVLLAAGCLRRWAPMFALAMMAFMLPLTAYIAIANPVDDCGCFGDLITLSNPATLVKNILLTAMLVVVFKWDKKNRPLFTPALQWIVIAAASIYAFIVALIGWNFQPIVDFRPYSIGNSLVADDSTADPIYIYSKEGTTREFALDALPDSSWTFVGIDEQIAAANEFAIFDGDDEVTYDVLNNEGETLILTVLEHDLEYLTRARFANEIYDYATARNIKMIGIVATSGEALEQWCEYARPKFDIYSATDTSVKQLARGAAALVMLRDGKVLWKRNFATLNIEMLESDDALHSVFSFDDGKVAFYLSGVLVATLILLFIVQVLYYLPKRKKCQTQSQQNPSN